MRRSATVSCGSWRARGLLKSSHTRECRGLGLLQALLFAQGHVSAGRTGGAGPHLYCLRSLQMYSIPLIAVQ